MSQMFPPDLAAALGGGGAPAGGPPAGGGALPPDIASLLGAGPGGPGPQPAGAPGGSSDPNAQSSDLLQQAQQLLKQAHDVEPEPEDQQVISQCINAIDKLMAKNQSEADGMMGGKMTPRGVRKAAAAQGGGSPYGGRSAHT